MHFTRSILLESVKFLTNGIVADFWSQANFHKHPMTDRILIRKPDNNHKIFNKIINKYVIDLNEIQLNCFYCVLSRVAYDQYGVLQINVP